MELWQVIILAVVQGLTEFLPISSSAHLILPSQVLGWPDQGLAFDVAVHFGSLLAILIYLRKELTQITVGVVTDASKRQLGPQTRLALAIILATIPAGLAGLVLNHWIEENLRSALVIAWATILFGILLGLSERMGKRERDMAQIGLGVALIIGLAQMVALIPGTSRSGITMTAALFLGFRREDSARFSFLLSVPLIAAAALLKTLELIGEGAGAHWGVIGLGTALSFVSAYACLWLFMQFIERMGFMPFVVYRLLLGTVLLALVAN